MGKIISLINTTPDGFLDLQYGNADAEFFEVTHQLLAGTQAVAFGRKTFELFQQVWPSRLENKATPEYQVKMAQALHDIPKQAYSSGLETTTWHNSTILKSIEPEAINHFKQGGQKGLLILGSLELVAALTEKHLVDDYYFAIQPLIAGSGNFRLFDKIKLNATVPLKLKSTKALQSGVVILHYESAN